MSESWRIVMLSFGKKTPHSQENVIYSEKWKLYDAGTASSTVKLGGVSLGWAFKHAYVKLFFFIRVGSEWQKHSSRCVIPEWFRPTGFCTTLLPERFSKKLFFLSVEFVKNFDCCRPKLFFSWHILPGSGNHSGMLFAYKFCLLTSGESD